MSDTFTYNLTTCLTYGLSFIYAASLLTVHSHLVVKQSNITRRNTQAKKKYNNCTDGKTQVFYATAMSLSVFTVYCLLTFLWKLIEMFALSTLVSSLCNFYIITVGVVYFLGKTSMMVMFLLRVQTSFKGSVYQYSDRVMNTVFTMFLVTSITMLCLLLVFGGGKSVKMRGYQANEESRQTCETNYPLIYVLTGVIQDLTWNVIALWMFYKPLSKLFGGNGQSDNCDNLTQLEMSLLPLKYGILTSVAIVSSSLSFLMIGITQMGILISIDTVINMTCIVMMNAVWKNTYWCVCSPLLSCLANHTVCLSPNYRTAVLRLVDHHHHHQNISSSNESMESVYHTLDS